MNLIEPSLQNRTEQNVYRWTGSRWQNVQAHLSSVVVNASGAVYGINTREPIQHNVFRWNGSGWDPLSGYLTGIAIGLDGAVFGVNANIQDDVNVFF